MAHESYVVISGRVFKIGGKSKPKARKLSPARKAAPKKRAPKKRWPKEKDVATVGAYFQGSEAHRCRHCGRPWGEHRASTGQCPPPGERFPAAPPEINSSDPVVAARAGQAWDLAIGNYWRRGRGRFVPR